MAVKIVIITIRRSSFVRYFENFSNCYCQFTIMSQSGAKSKTYPSTKNKNIAKSNNNKPNNVVSSKRIVTKPTSKIHQLGRTRNVEILDPKILESAPLPNYRIESENGNVNLIEEKIAQITGTSRPSSSHLCNNPEPLTDLTRPQLQSSLTLMKNLEKLKELHIDSHTLLQSKLKNKETVKAIERKISSVVNVDPSKKVFNHLQPLCINEEHLVSTIEQKRQNVAEKFAPKRVNKDPELLLSDFVPTPQFKLKPHVPDRDSFLSECQLMNIDPLVKLGIPESNRLMAYQFWQS